MTLIKSVPTMTPDEIARWERRLLSGRLQSFCEGDDDTCPSAFLKYMPDGRQLCRKHAAQVEARKS